MLPAKGYHEVKEELRVMTTRVEKYEKEAKDRVNKVTSLRTQREEFKKKAKDLQKLVDDSSAKEGAMAAEIKKLKEVNRNLASENKRLSGELADKSQEIVRLSAEQASSSPSPLVKQAIIDEHYKSDDYWSLDIERKLRFTRAFINRLAPNYPEVVATSMVEATRIFLSQFFKEFYAVLPSEDEDPDLTIDSSAFDAFFAQQNNP